MKLLKLFSLSFLFVFLTACGGGDSDDSNDVVQVSNEDIIFEERQNGDLEISWNKVGNNYKVLAVEDNGGSSKDIAYKESAWKVIYETSNAGQIFIVCTPDALGSSAVTYQCSITQDGTFVSNVEFILYSVDDAQDFAIGVGDSYDSAEFQIVEEQISTNGLDIEMKFGEYQLLDTVRTFDEYHGYFLLLDDEVAKGREFFYGSQITEDYEFVWSYDRDTKQLVLDNTAVGGGYAEGKVFGNSDEVHVEGFWNNGSALSATLTYLGNSTEFTRNSKIIRNSSIRGDDVNHF